MVDDIFVVMTLKPLRMSVAIVRLNRSATSNRRSPFQVRLQSFAEVSFGRETTAISPPGATCP